MLAVASRHSRALPCAAARVLATAVQTRAFSVPQGAWNKYYENELSYTSFPASKIDFKSGKDYKGNSVPVFYVDGEERDTLRHLVPWASVQYATSGLKGDIGKNVYNSQLKIDATKAQQLVNLGLSPVDEGEEANTHFQDYLRWLQDIQGILAGHINDHLKEYRALNSKYKSFASKEIFLANMTMVMKTKKDEQGEVIPGTEYVSFSHKMFRKPFKEVNPERITVPLDRQVFEEHGLVRAPLTWFDAKGEQIPLEKQTLGKGDIVCLDVELSVSMYETHYGLKPRTKRVVVLQKAAARSRNNNNRRAPASSPFGDLTPILSAP